MPNSSPSLNYLKGFNSCLPGVSYFPSLRCAAKYLRPYVGPLDLVDIRDFFDNFHLGI